MALHNSSFFFLDVLRLPLLNSQPTHFGPMLAITNSKAIRVQGCCWSGPSIMRAIMPACHQSCCAITHLLCLLQRVLCLLLCASSASPSTSPSASSASWHCPVCGCTTSLLHGLCHSLVAHRLHCRPILCGCGAASVLIIAASTSFLVLQPILTRHCWLLRCALDGPAYCL